MRNTRTRAVGAIVLGSALLLSACGGDDGDEPSASATDTSSASTGASEEPSSSAPAEEPVELVWWHNATQDPLKGYFQTVADAYTAMHPNVTFKIEPIQNETIQTKIQVALQSNDPPDIFQQWGGGDLATQVAAGKVQDITDATKDTVAALGGSAGGWQTDGKQYGIPYTVGIVGFWYRKDLFQQAGITGPPTTMAELNADVEKLKAADIQPIALGGKDKWPEAFYWGYFATRECSTDALQQATADTSISGDPCFLKAGEDTQNLIKTEPFNNGFLGTPAQQGAASSAGLIANGKAAMELMGQWDPPVIAGLTKDQKALSADVLGFFPFPAVDGGAGDPTSQFGGGDGFSCSVNAPPACADFLNFLLSVDNQKAFAEIGNLPVTPGSETAVTDPGLLDVIKFRNNAAYVQLYFDKALPTAVGAALNDEVANMFAGQGSPQSVVDAVDSAK